MGQQIIVPEMKIFKLSLFPINIHLFSIKIIRFLFDKKVKIISIHLFPKNLSLILKNHIQIKGIGQPLFIKNLS